MDEAPTLLDLPTERYSSRQKAGLTVLACVLTTALATPLLAFLDLANIVMLFLLTVLVIAVKLGRTSAIWASVLSVLLFDVFFVPPRFSLAVSNVQYLVTFAVMLVTGLVTAHLAAGLKQKVIETRIRERQTQALYDLARQLAGALALEQVREIVGAFVARQFAAQAHILLPEDMARGEPDIEPHLARVVLDSGHRVVRDDIGQLGMASIYLPLRAAIQTRGVLALRMAALPEAQAESTLDLLEALATVTGIALERLHYADVAQETELNMLSERLRNSILSALSHDLRTPLTALVGLAGSLSLIKPPLPPVALETAEALHAQAERLSGLVANLLDMARLNAGKVTLRKDWQSLEEVIGASIKLLTHPLAGRRVRVNLPADLPLLEVDAVLLERVICNLLENAAKYSPEGSDITIAAELLGASVQLHVQDLGPGFAQADTEPLFDMFVRGPNGRGESGSGLGLAICRAIVEAHGGQITAGNRPGGGADVCFTLPCGEPPQVDEEVL